MSANSSILGDSWVVEAAALPTSRKHKNKHEAGNLSQLSGSSAPRAPTDQTKNPQSPRDTKTHGHGSESTATSVSSISGPELIMPSIYETPVPEASWIAPNVRPSRQTVRRRHPGPAREDDHSSEAPKAPNTSPDRTQEDMTREKHHPKHTNNKRTLIHRLQPTARILLNALLAAAIAHLLVLPELITQHQSILCAIPAIPSLYPTSCAPHALFTGAVASSRHKKSQNKVPAPTREEQLTQLASHLERLFTQTLTSLTPLSPLLKQSDSKLRTLQAELHASFPGRRNELELEFSGLWEAARTGVRKFDSLRADLQSAVDNLIATTGATTHNSNNNSNNNGERAKNKNTGEEGGGEHETSNANANANANAKAQARIAQITSAQLSRRESYLDQLTSRMQDKADALASDLATVEDHLESIEGIILREERQGQGWRVQPDSPSSSTSSSTSTSGKAHAEAETDTIPLLSRLLALRHSLSSVRQARSDRSARETLVAATTGHRGVAEAVRNLSQRLEAVQRRKTS